MKLGLIADIHGNSPALKAVLSRLHETVDHILFLGDLCGYYYFVNDCLELWDENKITSVRGNHDDVLLQSYAAGDIPDMEYQKRYGTALERSRKSLSEKRRGLIESWPVQRELMMGQTSISMFHGTPWDPLQGRVYPDFAEWERFSACKSDVIVMGHTHYPLYKIWHDKRIINPGSVGQPRDRSGKAQYAVLDLSSGQVTHRDIPYDKTIIIEDVVKHDSNISYLLEVL